MIKENFELIRSAFEEVKELKEKKGVNIIYSFIILIAVILIIEINLLDEKYMLFLSKFERNR